MIEIKGDVLFPADTRLGAAEVPVGGRGIGPSDPRIRAEAPWHRGHCWALLPIALKRLGKP